MTPQEIYRLLATAECGAYAMSLDQKIMFWNKGAERILGFQSDEVLGRRAMTMQSAKSLSAEKADSLMSGCAMDTTTIWS